MSQLHTGERVVTQPMQFIENKRKEGDHLKEAIDIGGLFRCCIDTINQGIQQRTEPPENGTITKCNRCNESMMLDNGVWRWAPDDNKQPAA